MDVFTRWRLRRNRSCLLLVDGDPAPHIDTILRAWGNPTVLRWDQFGLDTKCSRRIRVVHKANCRRVRRPEPGYTVMDATKT